jgi:FkbM family methyltransferase
MKLPWTVAFFQQWLPYMSPLSVFRYRNAVLRVPRNPIRDGALDSKPERDIHLKIKKPFESPVRLRENAFDFITLEEVIFEQVYRTILSHLPRCERIIDLGANIGLASLYFAACYPSCKIAAVEPFDRNYALLVANLSSLIKAGRCHPVLAAVWSEDRVLAIEAPQIAQRYNAYSVRQADDGSQRSNPVEVNGLSVPTIMGRAGFREVDLVKVDIEGAETELLRGNLDWLNRTRALAIEFHNDSRAISNFDQIMNQYGFEIHSENCHTVLAVRSAKANSKTA